MINHYNINYKWNNFTVDNKKHFGITNKNEYNIFGDFSHLYHKTKNIQNNLFNSELQLISNLKLQLMFNNYYLIDNDCHRISKIKSNPILLDILFSGCNLTHANSTHKNFDENMKSDILEILQLFPNCVYSNFGQLRCRTNVTPIVASCVNKNIPLDIIEILVKESNKSQKILKNKNICFIPMIKFNGNDIDILEDLYINSDNTWFHSNRMKTIKNIFDRNKLS